MGKPRATSKTAPVDSSIITPEIRHWSSRVHRWPDCSLTISSLESLRPFPINALADPNLISKWLKTMRVSFQKKLWWRLARKSLAALALLSFSIFGIGIPMPVGDVKENRVPFICQAHACGCASAEQCWRHCCCFTATERWAWAKAHDVEPPAYAERPTPHETEHAHSVCCDHAHQPSSTDEHLANSQRPVRWVVGLAALRCHGLTGSWISGAAVVPPPVMSWSPELPVVGWVSFHDLSLLSLAVCPLDPPPR